MHILILNKGYVYLPVPKPLYEVPNGLKDRGEFHITIIEPPEVSRMMKGKTPEEKSILESKLSKLTVGGNPKAIGLGKQAKDSNEVYYAVIKWPEAQELRKEFDLPAKDLHVTIGFWEKDIFNVPKDESTLV